MNIDPDPTPPDDERGISETREEPIEIERPVEPGDPDGQPV